MCWIPLDSRGRHHNHHDACGGWLWDPKKWIHISKARGSKPGCWDDDGHNYAPQTSVKHHDWSWLCDMENTQPQICNIIYIVYINTFTHIDDIYIHL